jgi:hypothetical protein
MSPNITNTAAFAIQWNTASRVVSRVKGTRKYSNL